MEDPKDDRIWQAVGAVWSLVLWTILAFWIRFAMGHFWFAALACGLLPWTIGSFALARTPRRRRNEGLKTLYQVADFQRSLIKDVIAFISGIVGFFATPSSRRRYRSN